MKKKKSERKDVAFSVMYNLILKQSEHNKIFTAYHTLLIANIATKCALHIGSQFVTLSSSIHECISDILRLLSCLILKIAFTHLRRQAHSIGTALNESIGV